MIVMVVVLVMMVVVVAVMMMMAMAMMTTNVWQQIGVVAKPTTVPLIRSLVPCVSYWITMP